MSDQASSSNGDLKIEPISMGQAMQQMADIVGVYISQMEPNPKISEMEPWKYRHIALACFIHALCMPSQHKQEMASILDAIAVELRDAP